MLKSFPISCLSLSVFDQILAEAPYHMYESRHCGSCDKPLVEVAPGGNPIIQTWPQTLYKTPQKNNGDLLPGDSNDSDAYTWALPHPAWSLRPKLPLRAFKSPSSTRHTTSPENRLRIDPTLDPAGLYLLRGVAKRWTCVTSWCHSHIL